MFRKELNELRNLGTQFAQAFTKMVETTVAQADEEVAIIYDAMQRLDTITCTQTALMETAQAIVTAMEQVQVPLSENLARNEVVMDNLDAMDSDLCIIEDDDNDEEEVDEVEEVTVGVINE